MKAHFVMHAGFPEMEIFLSKKAPGCQHGLGMKTFLVWLAMVTLPLMAAEKVADKPDKKPEVVVVGGQVKRPDVIEYRKNTTILAMIVAAGGPTDFGSMKRVKVIRSGKALVFDLTDAKVRNEALALPDDTIEVPMKNILCR